MLDELPETLSSALADGRVLLVVAAVLLVIAVLLFVLWRRAAGRARRVAAPADHSADPVDPVLIALMLDLSDLATTPSVRAQVDRVLQRLRLEPIAVAPGDPFDPDIQSSVEVVPTADEDAPAVPTVDTVLRGGWRHDGKVIRSADVTVRMPRA